MRDALFLNVPYSEKNKAKSLGARWSPERNLWYVPTGADASLFQRWIPETSTQPNATLVPPAYLVTSVAPCWKCPRNTPVVTLASDGIQDHEHDGTVNEFVTLSWISWLSAPLERLLSNRFPFYYRDCSQTAALSYFINHCKCGARLGDFYLHDEPAGAFCPITTEQCRDMTLIALPKLSSLAVACSYCVTSLDWTACASRSR